MGTKSKRATSTNNLLYGKGIIYFAPLEAGVNKGEIDLGEAPSFSVQPMTDKLERFSSREGFKKKIFEAITEVGAQCKFVLIEYNLENINLAFLGSGNVPVSQSSGQVTGEEITARLDRWVKLPHRNISNVTVTGHTENTDYKVDYDLGRIMALSEGGISQDESLTVDYDYAAWSGQKIRGLEKPTVEGYLHFVGDPEYGPAVELEAWKARLTVDAEVPLISDDAGELSFAGEFLADETNHPDEPFFTVTEPDAAYYD